MSKHEKLLFVQNVSKLKKDEQIFILKRLVHENIATDESGKETLVNMKDVNNKLFSELNEYVMSCIKFNSNIQVTVKYNKEPYNKELTDKEFAEYLIEQQATAHGLTLTQMKESKKKLKTLVTKIKRNGKELKKLQKPKPAVVNAVEDQEDNDTNDPNDTNDTSDPNDTNDANDVDADIENKDDGGENEETFEEETTIDNDKWLDE